MTKQEKVLIDLDLTSTRGLEIGALDKPMIPPSTPGVFYVDHLNTKGLHKKYKDDASVNKETIVEVSGVWGKKPLKKICAGAAPFDFIVASHVIEHVPDLITWLEELGSVLKDDGQIRLVIPDKRFTFDFLRAETQIADVLNARLVHARVPQPRSVIDFILNAGTVDCQQAWAGTVDPKAIKKFHPPEDIMRLAKEALRGIYHDVHCWVVTPLSFAKLMEQLAEYGYLNFKCNKFFDTEVNNLEFHISLQKCSNQDESIRSWRQLQEEIQKLAVPQLQSEEKQDTEQKVESAAQQLQESEPVTTSV